MLQSVEDYYRVNGINEKCMAQPRGENDLLNILAKLLKKLYYRKNSEKIMKSIKIRNLFDCPKNTHRQVFNYLL